MCCSLLQWNSFFGIVDLYRITETTLAILFIDEVVDIGFMSVLSYLKSNFGKQQKCFPINIHVDYDDPLFFVLVYIYG